MRNLVVLLFVLCAGPAFAAELAVHLSTEIAPPPAAPAAEIVGSHSAAVRAETTLYSIGDPSPEEQLYLELINRARANPTQEGILLATVTDAGILADYDFFNIDTNLLQSQFAAITPSQPLAFSAKLTTAARVHSQDMFQNVYQDHTGSDGSTPTTRITDVGFFGVAGENVYANAKSVLHGHAAFEVDWGGPLTNGGMQFPSGHRLNIHNASFREAGIGVVLGSNAAAGHTPDHVGPQIVTQDLGVAQNSTPFITGVAYYDFNGNNFYDLNEGIGNVQVSVTGSSYQAITSRAGGYAIPVPGNGTYTVTFSGSDFGNVTKTISVVGSKNVKVDFTPPYTPPSITGPVVATVGHDNSYSISPVGGATDYQWRSFQKVAAAPEGAENDSTRLTITQSGSYDVIEGIVVKSGSFAFHLVTPSEAAESQYITLAPTYLINSGSSLTFASQLGYATADQHAQVQISTDDGVNWTTLYNQSGSTDHPESTWQQRTVNLAAYAGSAVRIRFALEFVAGVYIPSTDLDVGWLIDDITFNSVQEISNQQLSTPGGTTFQFNPSVVGDFSLQAHARTGYNFLDWGPPLSVRSAPASGAAELHLSVSIPMAGQIQIDVTLVSGAPPAALALQSQDAVNGTWQSEPATVHNISATQYRVSVPTPANSKERFYRIQAN